MLARLSDPAGSDFDQALFRVTESMYLIEEYLLLLKYISKFVNFLLSELPLIQI